MNKITIATVAVLALCSTELFFAKKFRDEEKAMLDGKFYSSSLILNSAAIEYGEDCKAVKMYGKNGLADTGVLGPNREHTNVEFVACGATKVGVQWSLPSGEPFLGVLLNKDKANWSVHTDKPISKLD